MHESSSRVTPLADRPHMAMLVGNHVVGDSRVEKSAVSAVRAGYRVTVVGTQHRFAFPVTQYEGVPIYRMSMPFPRYMAWRAWQALRPSRQPDWAAQITEDGELARVGTRAHAALRDRPRRRTVGERLVDRAGERSQLARDRIAARLPGGWRTVWPMIVDFEEAFLAEMLLLQPDIIHCHDRHPLAAAASYARLQRRQGRRVPWVYDAHEWLPGQAMAGPPQAPIGWIAAEAELIHDADAVISVTQDLAERMRDRHRLAELPTTVINAPRSGRQPLDAADRLPLRQELELAPEIPLMVYIGRLADVRGIFTMIESLPHLPGVHAAFVGNRDDIIRGRMRDRAAELGVAGRVHLIDYVPSSSVTWYIEGATLGVSPLLPTPAHDLAVPTKLREYAQAGLPLIVSNLQEQAAFVRNAGIGTTFTPGDGASFARAARELLEDYGRFAAAVRAPAFLEEHTWEGAEKSLTAVWHGLCPTVSEDIGIPAVTAPVSATEATTHRPSLVVVGGDGTDSLLEAWGTHEAPARWHRGLAADDSAEASERPGIEEQLRAWMRLDASADLVLYAEAVSAYAGIDGNLDTEIRSLQHRGKAVGVLAGGVLLTDAVQLRALRPGHPALGWDEEVFGRFRRQSRRAAAPFLRLHRSGVPLFTQSRFSALVLPDAHWCPVVVPETPFLGTGTTGEAGDALLRLCIVPTMRTAAEEAALDLVVDEAQRAGHVVSRPSSRRFTAQQAASADLVIDALHTGEYSEAAAWAWRAGRLVVGGPQDLPTDGVAGQPPILTAGDADLVEVVRRWVGRLGGAEADAVRQDGRAYAERVHDGRHSVEVIRSVLEA